MTIFLDQMYDFDIKEVTFCPQGKMPRAKIKLGKEKTMSVKCEKCGENMKKMDDSRMKCEKCGTFADAEKPAKKSIFTKAMGALARAFGKEDTNPRTTSEVLAGNQFWTVWWKLRPAYEQSIDEILDSDAPDRMTKLVESTKEFLTLLEEAASQLEVAPMTLELVDSTLSKMFEMSTTLSKSDVTRAFDEVEKQLAAPQKVEKSMTVAIKKDEGKTPPASATSSTPAPAAAPAQTEEEMMKSLPEPLRKALEEKAAAAQKALDEKNKALEDAKVALAKEKADRRESELRIMAKALTLSGETEDTVVATYKELDKIAPALLDKVHTLLKSASAVAEKASAVLNQEHGVSGKGESAVSSEQEILNQAQTLAKEYMAKDKNLSQREAMTKVWRDNPKLYKQYDAATTVRVEDAKSQESEDD